MKTRVQKHFNKVALERNIIKPLKRAGLHITYKQYHSGYFIFSRSANSILHFRIKELPDILFGVWMNFDHKKFCIFGENDLFIDKFKPTRCSNFDSIKEVVNLVKKYQSGEYSYRYILEEIFNSKLAHGYEIDNKWFWKDLSDDNVWKEQYNKDIFEQHFRDTHYHFNPNEYEVYLKKRDKIIKYLKSKDFILAVFLYRLDFFREPYSIEFIFNNKVNELPDEEYQEFWDKIDEFENEQCKVEEYKFNVLINWIRLCEKSRDDLRKILFTNKNNTIIKEKNFKLMFQR